MALFESTGKPSIRVLNTESLGSTGQPNICADGTILDGAVYVTLVGVWLLSVPDPARDQVTLVLAVMVIDWPAPAAGAKGLKVGVCVKADTAAVKNKRIVRMTLPN